LLSDAPQSFVLKFSVPQQMPAGSYDVMLAIAPPANAQGKASFTPVSCGGDVRKAAACSAGKIEVSGGKPG
jgi:hypothetical protein